MVLRNFTLFLRKITELLASVLNENLHNELRLGKTRIRPFFKHLSNSIYPICIFFAVDSFRRQKEIDKSVLEAEMHKKVDELVAKRMEAELHKREELIEAEVKRRVTEARRTFEKELQEEFDKQRQVEYKKQLDKEVCVAQRIHYLYEAVALCRRIIYLPFKLNTFTRGHYMFF